MDQYSDRVDSADSANTVDRHPDRDSRVVDDLKRRVSNLESQLYRAQDDNRRLQRALQRLSNDVDNLRIGLINSRG